MRILWRGADQALGSHADWMARIGSKNSRPGTSAPTLAAVWAGLVDVYGAMSAQPALHGYAIEEVVVEAQAAFDEFGGGPRNHDLVLRGRLPSGDVAVVCIEAKAGETLGNRLAEQRQEAAAAKRENPRSRAEERIAALVERFVKAGHPDAATDRLRYQLLTALAGTVSEANDAGATTAVLMLHEFRTDQRPNDLVVEHGADLREFAAAVFGIPALPDGPGPWCVPLGATADAPDVRLYLARAVTDLRADAHDGVHARPAAP